MYYDNRRKIHLTPEEYKRRKLEQETPPPKPKMDGERFHELILEFKKAFPDDSLPQKRKISHEKFRSIIAKNLLWLKFLG